MADMQGTYDDGCGDPRVAGEEASRTLGLPSAPPADPPQPAASFKAAPLHCQATSYAVDGSTFVHVRAGAGGERQPITLIAILDNSGSMQASADIAGTVEVGFSVLDLVKHATLTMASTLGPADALAIVTYSTSAVVVLPPTPMDDAGKAAVRAALAGVQPDSQTNIYDGIRTAAGLASHPSCAGRHIVGMLLTDGFPNVNPPRGIVPTLMRGDIRLDNPWTLHTFAFGYSVDSSLLADIASWGHGLFGFVPDASMVGTVFINFLAHVLSTVVTDGRVVLGQDDGRDMMGHAGGADPVVAGPAASASAAAAPAAATGGTVVYTGPIVAGQPRDIVFKVQGQGQGGRAGAAAPPAVVTVNGRTYPVTPAPAVPAFAHAHWAYCEAVGQAIALAKGGAQDRAADVLAAFYHKYSGSTDAGVKALLKDVKGTPGASDGQVGLAVTPAYWGRWGEHYLRAYQRAQMFQQCMNFKDPGLQIYGGPLFQAIQAQAENLFITLEPPMPSLARHRYGGVAGGHGAGGAAYQPIDMSTFHNVSGGCFAGGTRILLQDGTTVRPIEKLKKGDKVHTPSGPAEVVCVVECRTSKSPFMLKRLDELCITPWHPIHYDGAWMFPAGEELRSAKYSYIHSRGQPEHRYVVYNLVLDKHHVVTAEAFNACTLGHGMEGDVIGHPYFGTQAVIRDLQAMPGWKAGRVVYHEMTATRDSAGRINGWKDEGAAVAPGAAVPGSSPMALPLTSTGSAGGQPEQAPASARRNSLGDAASHKPTSGIGMGAAAAGQWQAGGEVHCIGSAGPGSRVNSAGSAKPVAAAAGVVSLSARAK